MMNTPSSELKPASQYHRTWRERNPEKNEEYQRTYAIKNAAAKRAKASLWKLEHPERYKRRLQAEERS